MCKQHVAAVDTSRHLFVHSNEGWPSAVAFLRQHHPDLSPFLATSLLLLSEMAKGQDSAFWPYLEALPASSDCLFHWETDEQDLLQGACKSQASLRSCRLMHWLLLLCHTLSCAQLLHLQASSVSSIRFVGN